MASAIIQWNIRGLRSNYEELLLLCEHYKPNVIALQETQLTDNKVINVKGFSGFSESSPGGNPVGGVSMYVSNNILSSRLELNTDLQAIAFRITDSKTYTVCNLYIPPSKPISIASLRNLLNQLPSPFIVVGDFNCRSTSWGDEITTGRGTTLDSFFHDENLIVLNSGEQTHYSVAHNSYSVLDLSVSQPSLALDFEWSVHSDLCGSDHYPIVLKCIHEDQPNTSHWNFKKADWLSFQSQCVLSLTELNILSEENPLKVFSDTLIEIASLTIPRTSSTGKSLPKVPWFTDECKKAIHERKRAQRKLFRQPSTENLLTYKRLKARARYLVKKSKKLSWQNYCSSMTSKTSSKKVWNCIRKIKGKKSQRKLTHLIKDGKVITDRKDVSNLLASTIAHNSSSNHYSATFQRLKDRAERNSIDFTSDNSEVYNCMFSYEELKESLHKSNNSTSGPDDIHYELLRKLPEPALRVLLKVFNHIWVTGNFPSEWREATIVAIPKPGKDSSNPSNYRPIALTSCLCKTMERMVNARLMWMLEDKGLLASVQCGFRKGRSTNDHLVRFESFVREAFVDDQHVLAIFFDIEKAYDTTWKYGILADLLDMDFRGRLPQFIDGFLTDRLFRVKNGGSFSDVFEQEMGVPQGSILSPVLFCIKINNIIKSVTKGAEASLFVDDFTLAIRGRYLPNVERMLQMCVNNVQEWVDKNGFKFSTAKTKCVHFTRKRGVFSEPSIKINKEVIKVSEDAKFLGVVFDKRLTFAKHVKELKESCQKALNVLRVVSSTDWGADSVTLLRLYRALVRSKLDYGCVVYGSASKSILRSLDPIHHAGLRISLGLFRTTPMHSLYVKANEPPLSLRRKKLTLNYVVKLKGCIDNPAQRCVFNEKSDCSKYEARKLTPPLYLRKIPLLAEAGIDTVIVDDTTLNFVPPWEMMAPEVNLGLTKQKKDSISSVQHKQAFIEECEKYPGFKKIFTDASKADPSVASAAVFGKKISTKRLNDTFTSIYTAELEAISLALEFIERSSATRFLVISDSLSALQSISSYKLDFPQVVNIKEKCHYLLSSGKRIVFLWVPGHVGILGNEKADQAAKNALGEEHSQASYISHHDLRPTINKYIYLQWQQMWSDQKFNKLYSIQPNVSEFLSMNVKNRKEESVLNRLHVGHTWLTHGHLLKNEPQPVCHACDEMFTIKHILIECADFIYVREKYYTNISSLSMLFRNVSVECIFNFLKEIGLFYKI